MKTKLIASSLVVAFLATGCESPKQSIGAIGGGALGALAGSAIGGGSGRMIAIAAGGILGAFLGGHVGGQLDKADREKAERTAHQALENAPSGRTSEWRNPDNGHRGTITPVRTYQSSGGEYCREFQQTITVGGKSQRAYGTACRQPDGAWKIVES